MGKQQDMDVAVVGAGTMGSGIAQIAALAGHRVIVVDAAEDALARGSAAIDKALAAATARGHFAQHDAEAAAARIKWSKSLAAVAGAGLVIEAIVERLDAKGDLFRSLEAIVSPDAILASNTSSLAIGAIAANIPTAGRVIGLHFFNPVPAMKLVEVVAGPGTQPHVVDQMMALMAAWGKRPVAVRDVPGFIVNRVARPYYAEAFAALEEGIAAEAIDHALTACGGFRMGALALADLIGQDVNFAVASSIHQAYGGHTRFHLQAAQRTLVQAGRLGRKAGSGVFDYPRDLPAPPYVPAGPVPRTIKVSAQVGPWMKLFCQAGLICQEASNLCSGMVEVDSVRLAISDGRPLSARDDVDGLLDVVRDFATASTIVLTARSDAAAACIAGLIQALGRSALRIPDRPGMLVLRTLAQIANAATDAVADGVAPAWGIDEAMVYGANHPEGPLHWAERFDRGQVAAALHNIADATGDAMYRPAPLLSA